MRRIVAEQTRQRFHLAADQLIFQFYFARYDRITLATTRAWNWARALHRRHELALDEVGGRFEQFN